MVRISCLALLLAGLSLTQSASAGWPFFSEDGLRRGTPEYYAARAADPPGSRQECYYGKPWPVSARPVGPEQTFVHKYHTAHYWPHPYQCQDRQSVRSYMDIQVYNGWQTATTFYDYHFDPQTNALNSAGMNHLAWLVSHVPVQHRQAYVQASFDTAANSARMLSVEKSIANLTNGHESIPVQQRVTNPLGRPAAEVQQILTGAAEGALPPVIQYEGSSGGFSTGG
ncbi:hypothetical protein KOR42_45780 [Thalassoglobus neptunius]|uniref:Uncharacterized protein n=1 Tax=Thalassoglobus neptunius TaxID=1938619 RepID=A0A5C5VWI4_9PLAN|nr:hypothetical protein [Thalassoglobus neptunius]TWT42978.1 hypothetical protein KOR42_45780 [Thalassoglobus neptunius]